MSVDCGLNIVVNFHLAIQYNFSLPINKYQKGYAGTNKPVLARVIASGRLSDHLLH